MTRKPELGLSAIDTEELKKLLAALHHGHLAFPLAIENLTRVGLQHCATELMRQLRELDERGVRAVLVNVIAERLADDGARVKDVGGRKM